ncbi:MAG: hypothetical protein H6737_03250 [Alphaproteobacteria bacterium]|nr:hypothetical protein [Alphaproteobacteria bacterium]
MTGPTLRRLRGLVLAAGLGFILFGPTYVQILGGPLGPFTRSWRMYTGVGRGLCEVRYTQVLGEGRTIRIDRQEILGLPRDALWEAVGVEAVRQDAAKLCERLGEGADLRAAVRCAGAEGWDVAIRPEQPLCRR